VLTDLNASLAASAVGTFGAATSVNVPLEVNRTALSSANLANTWYIGTKNTSQSPLPVELTNFMAEPSDPVVLLSWTTATETNNDLFTVERSKDAMSFEFVGTKSGAGTSSTAHSYSLVDESPYHGLSYYRLKQTDFNGSYTYSTIVAVNMENGPFEIIVFPNPSNGEFNISVKSESSEVLVVLYDAMGKEIFTKVLLSGVSGDSVFAVDPAAKLAPGIYIISASADNKLISKKLIIR
jgi:hypothetical protein